MPAGENVELSVVLGTRPFDPDPSAIYVPGLEPTARASRSAAPSPFANGLKVTILGSGSKAFNAEHVEEGVASPTTWSNQGFQVTLRLAGSSSTGLI